ncbi:MAG: glycosyltransferase [Candidatus Dormibacteraeota bacterium]|nr:glycosyltransferase [Candidatus Dormibacteraeota bacterium]MBV9524415.1 glycosyltransferase [Candidatus Dormibacteraeota bacterium]
MSTRTLRILYVAPYQPSLLAVRPRLLIQEIARRHDVDVLTLQRGPDPALVDAGSVRTVRRSTADPLLALGRVRNASYPLQSVAAASRALDTQVRSAVRSGRYDLVHVEHIRALQYLPGTSGVPVMFDAVDCVSRLFALAAAHQPARLRWLYRLESRRAARLETRALRLARTTVVASQRDAALMRRLHDGASIAVVPNPVDLERFMPGAASRPPTVVMTGKMSFHANAVAALWLCDEVWPRVRAQRPDATLVIAGDRPRGELLRPRPGITVAGRVADMAAVLRTAAVAVAPLRYAVGVQNKVLEAMACATPVVATPCAVGDLRLQHGREVMVGETAAELANLLTIVLGNPELGRRVGAGGRAYVERNHATADAAATLEDAYAASVDGASRRAQRAGGGMHAPAAR